MWSLIAMYDDEIERARAEHRGFMEVIQAVKDDDLRELLRLHYVDGLTWERVAERTWYCIKTVKLKYNKSLTAVYKIICDSYMPPW